MPKIGKPKVVQKVEEKQEESTPQAVGTISIFFGENEISEMDSDTLDKLLLLYGVSVRDEAKKAKKSRITDAYKRELLLGKQEEYAKAGKKTPDGLLEVAGTGAAHYGKVHVNLGLTINQGNYSSLKIDAGTELPINFTDEQMQEVKTSLRRAMNGVQTYIDEDLDGIEGNMSKHFKHAN